MDCFNNSESHAVRTGASPSALKQFQREQAQTARGEEGEGNVAVLWTESTPAEVRESGSCRRPSLIDDEGEGELARSRKSSLIFDN